ncbi:MAG: M3 family metallopeptidase [bacterium]|nr:M3 family metallopeptidase [bacterium]
MDFRVSIIVLVVVLSILSVSFGFCSRKTPVIREDLAYHLKTVEDVVTLFPKKVDDINRVLDRYMQKALISIDQIISIPGEQRTFENTALALDRLISLSDLAIAGNIFSIVEVTNTQEAMRNAAHDAVMKIQNFSVDNISNNKQLYVAFKAYAQGNALKENLSPEQRYFIQETMDGFVRAGLDLPDDTLEMAKKLKKELAQLMLDFDRNIAQDKSTITVKHEGLKGLEQDFITTLKQTDDGKYIIGVDYPTVFHVMANCVVEDTRKQLYFAFSNRAYPANDVLLQQIIAIRDQLARLIGFDSYAHLDLDDQMVKNPDRAYDFLNDLIKRARKKVEKEFEQWTADLPESVTLTDDGKVKPWDMQYIQNQYKKKYLAVDEQRVKEYFPMEKTIESLLAIYKQFLSIDFEEVPVSGTWHEDVKLVKVYGKDRAQLLGYLFLDLYPRPDKYSHACHAGFVHSVINEDGSLLTPGVSMMIANFPKSTPTKPSLLRRDDVQVFFHEFGHALHAMLGATRVASFSGTSVKRDFVEMPSQMLEEWLWDKEILKKVSSHYQTGKPLSDELIDKIIALKRYDSGYFINRQAFLSTASLDYYMPGEHKNPLEIWQCLHEKITPEIMFDQNSHGYASFGHLTGYGPKYYGYMWSKVFALDLFNTIKKQGLLNPEIGQKYVREVLGKGGSQDPNELLRNFLGREPNSDAFFADLGLTS